jgi:dienelactone hydrolase
VTDGRRARIAVIVLAIALAATSACHRSPTEPTVNGGIPGFTLVGNPSSAGGATWTYQAQDAGIRYDLQGILLVPAGPGPFPAAIISHGNSSSVAAYSRTIAQTMVGWGLVCIATNYTFAGNGVPVGSPGSPSDLGASTSNVLRARKLVDILRGLGNVDMNRVVLHGHSLGAFVGEATAGAYPTLFRAASHTAGGIAPDFVPDLIPGLAPTEAQIAGIRAPYQMHHGDRDIVVPLIADQLFDAALRSRGVTHELLVYPGASHDDVRFDPQVLDRIRAWYRSQGVF